MRIIFRCIESSDPVVFFGNLQMFYLTVATEQLLLLCEDKSVQRLSIQGVQLSERGVRISHGREYATELSQ
jgi:hypothetical protein